MRESAKGTEQSQFLSGWKEIASYLDKGVRTVQRYERELGLPVRRPAGKPTGSVVATRAELDAWIAASPIREAFQLTKPGTKASAGTAESMRAGLVEMARLREQMLGLRNDVRTSLEILRQSLYGLQGDLTDARSRERLRQVKVVEPQHQTDYVLNLLNLDSKRKAS
jgi:hypothetical protein